MARNQFSKPPSHRILKLSTFLGTKAPKKLSRPNNANDEACKARLFYNRNRCGQPFLPSKGLRNSLFLLATPTGARSLLSLRPHYNRKDDISLILRFFLSFFWESKVDAKFGLSFWHPRFDDYKKSRWAPLLFLFLAFRCRGIKLPISPRWKNSFLRQILNFLRHASNNRKCGACFGSRHNFLEVLATHILKAQILSTIQSLSRDLSIR